jgi:hypothetical protein
MRRFCFDLTTRVVSRRRNPSNISKRVEFKLGDLAAGFTSADEIVEMSLKKDRTGTPGLYRAARLHRRLRRRRTGRTVKFEPGDFRRPRLHGASSSE